MTNTELGYDYDLRTPRTGHSGLAAAQFHEYFVSAEGPILNVAAGRTNLAVDLQLQHIEARVTSLDPMYTSENSSWLQGEAVTGMAQSLPFEDDTFAVSLMHYGLQHLQRSQDMKLAIGEMLRVTRPSDSAFDQHNGTIIVGPVFDTKTLRNNLLDTEFGGVCAIEEPPTHIRHGAARPALIIKKVPELAGREESLSDVIVSSGAMKPGHRTLAELACRIIWHGNSKV